MGDERLDDCGLVKDYCLNLKNKFSIDTHIRLKSDEYMDRGMTNWYYPDELVKWYGNCECSMKYYQKDYGEDDYGRPIIAIRSFLIVYANQDFDEQIIKEREEK